MSGLTELKSLLDHYPERFDFIAAKEKEINSTYYRPDKIPQHARTNNLTSIKDLRKYLTDKNQTIDLFDEETPSCTSFYNLCE
jgi:hypothetical protein